MSSLLTNRTVRARRVEEWFLCGCPGQLLTLEGAPFWVVQHARLRCELGEELVVVAWRADHDD